MEAPFEVLGVDVARESSVKDVVRILRGRGVVVNALVNAAGIASMNLAVMAPASSVRRIVETNLLGTMFMCQAFAPLLIRAGGGRVVNFSTIAVALGLQGESAYAASKAGVETFSRTLARELAGHRITVNCVAPGPIATDLLKGVTQNQIDDIIGRQIIQRQFTHSDVCDVVEVLLDEKSGSLTGHVLHVGGV
jgi:3-oxoacyl-[acyl-carrier protein] reductase